MNPQLAAYLLILATFSPAVIVGWLVWWGTRGEQVAEVEPEDHTVLIGRVGWHPSIGAFVEWTACDPAAEAEQILREDAA